MNRKGIVALIMALIMMMSMMTLLSGCGEDDEAVQVSGADVSASDEAVSESDWRELLDSEEEKAIAALIVSNCDAFNAEDIEGYMAAIASQSESYASTKEDAQMVFEKYNLTTTIDEIKVDWVGEGEAQATVTQTMRRREGDEEGKSFTATETVLQHTLTEADGKWYIASTLVINRRELTDKWTLFEQFVSDPSIYKVPSGSDAMANEEA